jgi:hypothetical protein
MKRLLMILLALCLVTGLNAQESQKQIGMRFGVTTGFSGKVIAGDLWAFEGIVGWRNGGMQAYGLIENYRLLVPDHLDNLWLFVGGGLHAGFVKWYDDPYNNEHPDEYYYGESHIGPAFGIDGIAGAEYRFNTIPLAAGLDFKPFFEFYGPFRFRANFWDFGVHIRYIF